MNFDQHRPVVVGQAFDDPALPHRALSIQALLHDIGGKAEQRVVVTGMRNRGTMDVVCEIEVRVVDPFRWFQIEKVCMQHLPKSRNRHDPLSHCDGELVEVWHRTLENRQTADGKTHVMVGILCFEKTGV